MPPPLKHFKDEIQDLLDNRLAPEMRAEVERHLASCEECRREFEAMRWTKQFAAKQFATPKAPAELRERITQSLREGDPRAITQVLRPGFRLPRLARIVAPATAFLIVAVLIFVFVIGRPAQTEIVARDYRNYRAQKLTLELISSDVKQMETFFAGHGISFKTRVFDLGMMNYRLMGGRVQCIHGATRALFAYQGSPNQVLVCEMYAGKVAELPARAFERESNGVRFYVYTNKNLTSVFWQEGAVVCVLTSDIPSEQVVQLAYVKAMPNQKL
jgi:anti-sigma factor RsiW